jgi:hypothetical protein
VFVLASQGAVAVCVGIDFGAISGITNLCCPSITHIFIASNVIFNNVVLDELKPHVPLGEILTASELLLPSQF